MSRLDSSFFIHHRFRAVGLVLAVIAVSAYMWFVIQGLMHSSALSGATLIDLLVFRGQPDLATRVIRSLFLIGIVLIILSREPQEDEWVQQVRLSTFSKVFLISIVSLIGYTVVGPVEVDRLVSVNVWVNLSALIYFGLLQMNLRRLHGGSAG